MEKMIYSKFSNERTPIFDIVTEIVTLDDGKKVVKKSPSSIHSVRHIENIYKWGQKLGIRFRKVGLRVNSCSLDNNVVYFEYIEGKSLENILDEYIEAGDKDAFLETVESYIISMKSAYDEEVFESSKEFEDVFGKATFSGDVVAVRELSIDMIFSNVIISDDVPEIIDYEWTFGFPIPINFLFYRAIYYYLLNSPKRQRFVGDSLMERFGIKRSEVAIYEKMEQNFQNNYVFKDFDSTYSLFEKFGMEANVVDYNVGESRLTASMFKVYRDFGNGYNEEESELFRMALDPKGTAILNLPIPVGVNKIRIDLGSRPCTIRIQKLSYVNEAEHNLKYKTNATYTSLQGEHLFLVNDPKLEIKLAGKPIKEIKLILEIDTISLETERLRLVRLLSHINIIRLVTTPLSKLYNVLKRRRFFRLLYTVLLFARREGMRATLKRIKLELKKRFNRFKRNSRILAGDKHRHIRKNDKDFNDIAILSEIDKSIVVHLHLYYEELLDEMVKYLKNIPYNFDLLISCNENADVENITSKGNQIKNATKVVVKKVENRGRDIKPIFVDFGKEIAEYDYFIHIHTKKSLYTGTERIEWRRHSLNSLLGTPEIVGKLFSLMEEDEKLGIVYPDCFDILPIQAYTWLANESGGRQLLEELNIDFQGGMFSYPAGSFYLAKTKALKPLFDLNLAAGDFQEEQGQNDGTLAHIIERAIAFIVESQAFEKGIVDYLEGVIRYGFSRKVFRPYFELDVENVKEQLAINETISFDIFDTLITRCVLKPDDLFMLMEKIILKKHGIKLDYLQIRKEAEVIAWRKKGDSTNIYDIYEEVKRISGVDSSKVSEFRELEIKLEYDMCMPRRDVLEIFDYLKGLGKRIILVSDMYLTSDIIVPMLKKCGYDGFNELYISCEVGLRKDNDTIWDRIIGTYGKNRFVHIGDNPRSDWQTLSDRGVSALFLMSSLELFKLTDLYSEFEGTMYNSIHDSLYWGLMVNGGLCNSPFALNGNEGDLVVPDVKGLGIGVFAPLLYMFTKWVINETKENEYLAFLSREGYLLEQLYDIAANKHETKKKGSMYFLSSRRAASVAASHTWDDIIEILKIDYKGSLLNMAKVRLGVDLEGKIQDTEIDLQASEAELNHVISKLEPFKDEILEVCKEERANYISYLEAHVPKEDWENLVVIDLGYVGTIQYNLAKMLDLKIGGYYLVIWKEPKPKTLGCKAISMTVLGEPFMDTMTDTHRFLEAVLTAPYGQLVNFEIENDSVVPRYREEVEMSQELKDMQSGILWYAEIMSNLTKDIFGDDDFEKRLDLTKEVYGKLMESKDILKGSEEIFAMDDSYCRNGRWIFDSNANQWKLV